MPCSATKPAASSRPAIRPLSMRCSRGRRNARPSKKSHDPPTCACTDSSLPRLEVRLARVGSRTRDASDAGREVAQAQEGYDIGQVDWIRIDAAGTAADTAAQV